MLIRYLLIVLVLSAAGMHQVTGQLLQDRNKLKTEIRKNTGGGFLFFRKKVKSKSSSSGGKVEKGRKPRFSRGSGGVSTGVEPKFSRSSRAGRAIAISPRYSRENAGQGGYRPLEPKFSQKSDRVKIIIVNPKYSRPRGREKVIQVNPKYSQPRGRERVIQVNPRFSQGSNVYNYVLKTPKTASDKGMVFEFPKVLQYISRPKNHGEDIWEGPSVKVNSWKGRKYHPSASHLMAKGRSSKLVREGMRKFNILWTRVNGNKSSPKGVDKKSGKDKYDKNESEIWNNKEREYIKN